jgi:hypothetical protein
MQIMNLRLWISLPLLALGMGVELQAQEGGIEVFAAETLFSRGTRVSVGHVFRSRGTLLDGSNKTSDALDRKQTEHRLVTSVAYGLRRDLSLSALLPVVRRELESDAGDERNSGLGDLVLLAKYQTYKKNWKRGAAHVALIGGLEFPTGETDARGAGGRLAPSLQAGQGAWSPFVGVSGNASFNRLRFDAIAFYKLNTEGSQDFERGDFLSLETDVAYRFLHAKYPKATASAKLGLQWRHQGSAQLDGSRLINSGSDELILRTGLTWHPAPRWDVTLALDLPLYQDYGGEQLALDHRTFFAVGIRF